jgi:DNA polymerase-3 subunit delta
MRLRAEQLAPHLKKSGLAPVYFISGDEPLQIMECVDEIRRYARQENFEERVVLDVEKGFDWNTLHNQTANISLFSTKRLLELRMGDQKPGRDGGAMVAEYATMPPQDNVLVITSARIDKKTQQSAWFSALDKAGITIAVWPVDEKHLPDWIQQRISKLGKQIRLETASLLAERVEGNLLAAKQEIEKLCLLTDHHEITPDDVLFSVADSTRFGVFELIETAQAGNAARTVRMLHGLCSEGVDPFEVYGAVMWDFRRLCSMACSVNAGVSIEKVFSDLRIWEPGRKQAIKVALKRHKTGRLHDLLRYAAHIDRTIKSQDKVIAWEKLQIFLLALAGSPVKQNEI